MEELKLIDISDDLLVINKQTIDKLCSLENAIDCIALYIFYYKTAKWQKSDTVKANDSYIIKSLKIGKSKLNKTKKTLRENGLIDVIQRRKENKIEGWYIKINYVVSEKKYSDITVQKTNNPQNEQVENSTSSSQDTNALKEYIKCLKKEIEMLKKEKLIKDTISYDLFDKFWNAYPRKVSKGNAEKWFEKNKPNEELVNLMISKISLLKDTEQWKKDNGQYIPYPTTWLNAKGWEDEIEVEVKKPYKVEKRFFN